ncbi:hypothetical protein O181_057581 [Austropuccinia psidii MF-1]|uniref:Integrase catalytic domain-containing protein n=1 Tax=Austropuccinia psidii MF-1 TaxID=1389203 RepID=A0A9Q3EFF8_9BASI|nr:hypothetical protein [Austropuccinia psidii MF-1]
MDWVTALPPGGDKSYNACIFILDGYRNTPIFFPCHKDDIAIDTALLIWNRVISHTGLLKNIISDRDPIYTSALSTNLHKNLGKKLSCSTSYHPQTDGLAERMIENLKEMIRRFCAHGLQFKDCDGLTHDWCTLIPALDLAYKTSIHASTGKTPAIFKLFIDKVNHHANQSINDAFEYAKQKWDKSHKTQKFKVGDLILASTFNLNNIKGPKKLKDSFAGPFIIKAFHGTNAVQVELSGELEKKNSAFPVSLVKHYTSSDKEVYPLRNEKPLEVPPLDQSEEKEVLKVLKERRISGKNEREYLDRYRNPQHEYEWISESKIADSQMFLRRFRHQEKFMPQKKVLNCVL